MLQSPFYSANQRLQHQQQIPSQYTTGGGRGGGGGMSWLGAETSPPSDKAMMLMAATGVTQAGGSYSYYRQHKFDNSSFNSVQSIYGGSGDSVTGSLTSSSRGVAPPGGEVLLSRTNLYIRGLTQNTTDEDLFELCKGYGKVISTKAIIDPALNKCKGYGFVDFEVEDDAQQAVTALQARGIQAQMAKQQEQDSTNLYFANLPPHISEMDLENILAPYGQVTSTRILRDMYGVSRGVGFARMESKEKCESIIQAFNGKVIQGCRQPLLVKFADGGSKKRKSFGGSRPWIDRIQNSNLGIALYSSHETSPQGLTPQMAVTPTSNFARGYPVSAFPITGYPVHMPSGWFNFAAGQYVVQPSMTTMMPTSFAAMDATLLPQLTSQFGQLQLLSDTTASQAAVNVTDASDLQSVDP
jgi:hypothetical protein